MSETINNTIENDIATAEETTSAAVGEVVSVSDQVETTEQPTHEVTLYAEPVFDIGSFTVTNSLINSWLVVLILIVFAVVIGKKIKRIPRGMQNAFEIVIDGAMDMADSVTGDRKKTMRIFPFAFAIFIFVLISNWLGIIPGIGSIGFTEIKDGHEMFIPFFRGSTADFNTTLALALFAVIGANVFGVLSIGAWKHFNKFVNLRALAEVPGRIRREPMIIFINPIKFFVGLIEIISEIAKIASLSFRLFGNVFAGEVLLSSIAVILAFALPIPFLFLEILVGVIQALIFSMLMLVYFTIASSAEEH